MRWRWWGRSPYLVLAEQLGSLVAQLAEGRMAEVHLRYAGEVAALATQPLTVTFRRGLLAVILEENVTDVSAPALARQRGLWVTESRTLVSEDFASLPEAELRTDRGVWRVAGTLFYRKEPRLVRIDDFALEAVPSGWILVFSNVDILGVICRIGTLFGRHGIVLHSIPRGW